MSDEAPRRPKVLIAEDYKELRDALENALSERFDVLPSATFSGTLLGFKRHHPEAVLISMKQQQGHGLELCLRLRGMQAEPPPFIVVYGTVPDLDEDVLEGDIRARYGPDRYMPRGVTIKKLDAVLREQVRSAFGAPARGPSARAPSARGPSDSAPRSNENEPAESSTPDAPQQRWSHPMVSMDVVSAKNPAPESGIFRRFWKKD